MTYFRVVRLLSLAALFVAASTVVSTAQSRVNSAGTGGMHTIQGRLYLPNGKALDNGITVRLESTNFGTMTVQSDRNGGFAFRSLTPGNYAVVVEGDEYFESVREPVTIDTEVNAGIRRVAAPKIFTLPIYLQLKRSTIARAEVINAKWSAVPKEAMERYGRGLELVRENKTTEAAAEFRASIAAYAAFAPAHAALGKILLKAGDLNGAVAELRTAVRYDDSDFDAHIDLGIALLNLKRYREAEPELVTAAYLNRTAVTPHYYLGILFVVRNDLDVARKAFETAKELKGSRALPTLHKYLGRIYMAKGMKKEALEELETYVKLAPDAAGIEKVQRDISTLRGTAN